MAVGLLRPPNGSSKYPAPPPALSNDENGDDNAAADNAAWWWCDVWWFERPLILDCLFCSNELHEPVHLLLFELKSSDNFPVKKKNK